MAAEEIVRACEWGDVDKVERLLPRVRNPADVRCGGWWTRGETLLHFFCHNGWLDMTRRLVKQYHCDLESRDWDGDTALHAASYEGCVDIVRYFISQRRCSTACQNINGNTPLYGACENRHLAVVESCLLHKTVVLLVTATLHLSYHHHLVAMLFADRLSLHLITFFMVFLFLLYISYEGESKKSLEPVVMIKAIHNCNLADF